MVATKAQANPDSASLATNVPIKCLGLSKVFKDFWLRNRVTAVNNIDLEVRQGEVFGLLGPNGSGKSTTIKMILGLLHPTAGKIAVLGRAPSDVSVKKDIGYLPEESYLYRFLTPGETLDYYGKLFGQDSAQRKKRIETLLEMVGLTHASRRPVGEFSKGMQRKVGLAQALINDPDLLILDEPTSGMDPIATAEVKQVILELKRRGKTVLLCSHLLGDVQDVCDRVVVMYGGKIREEGPLGDLLQVQDKTVIETDYLQDDLVTEIEKVLERHGRSVLKSEHPRKDLEQLFLEIVEKAQTEGAQTAGATQGGKIASFLSDGSSGARSDESESKEVLDALSGGNEEAEVPASEIPDPAVQATEDTKVPDIDPTQTKQAQRTDDALLNALSNDEGQADTATSEGQDPVEVQDKRELADMPAKEKVDQSVLDALVDEPDKN